MSVEPADALEDLLNDALKDFDEDVPVGPSKPTDEPVTASTSQAPASPQPRGLGLGLGPRAKATPRLATQSKPPESLPPAGPPLPPDIQKLADDLMRLVEDSGLGKFLSTLHACC